MANKDKKFDFVINYSGEFNHTIYAENEEDAREKLKLLIDGLIKENGVYNIYKKRYWLKQG